jgi:hypothetical protein
MATIRPLALGEAGSTAYFKSPSEVAGTLCQLAKSTLPMGALRTDEDLRPTRVLLHASPGTAAWVSVRIRTITDAFAETVQNIA